MAFYTRGENLQRPTTAVSLIRGMAFTVPRLPGQTKPQLFCYFFPARKVGDAKCVGFPVKGQPSKEPFSLLG